MEDLGEDRRLQAVRAPRRGEGRGGRGRGPPLSGGEEERPAVELARRPASCSSAAASRRSARRRWWSCAASRQGRRRPRCARAGRRARNGAPPGSPAGCAAARSRRRRRRHRRVRAARDGRSRRQELEEPVQFLDVPPRLSTNSAGSACAGSSERTSSWRRSPKRSTRPRTRTASPSPKRLSSSSTSFQTRASILPVGSTSSSARYGLPERVPEPLTRDRVEALDDPVLRELRDRHPAILGPGTDGKLARSAPAQAVSRPSLRRGDGGDARRSSRTSVRRHHSGRARRCWPEAPGTPCGSSVPTTLRRRPASSPTGASEVCSCARPSRRSGSWRRSSRAPTTSAGGGGGSSPACGCGPTGTA